MTRIRKHIYQRNLFDPPEPVLDQEKGRLEQEAGIKRAEVSANNKSPEWIDRAYEHFKKWLAGKPDGHLFMMEEARGDLPIEPPPSNRSYGGIIKRAQSAKLIKSVGLKPVSNVKAHACFATQWMKVSKNTIGNG